MKTSRVAPWLSRLVLLAATFILVMIGRKFIGDPVGAAAASNMLLGSPLAITNMRASFRAFPLGCAIFTFLCLVSADRRLTGLSFVAIIIGTALAVRVFGVVGQYSNRKPAPSHRGRNSSRALRCGDLRRIRPWQS